MSNLFNKNIYIQSKIRILIFININKWKLTQEEIQINKK